MTVLHVDSVVAWGGGQEQVLALVRGLADRGVRSAIAAPPMSRLLERAAHIEGVAVHAVPLRGDVDPIGSARLWHVARREGAVLLHAHSAHAHALCIPVARALGLPLVVTRRNLSAPPARPSLHSWIARIATRAKYRAATRVLCVSPAVLDDIRRVASLSEASLRHAHTALTRTSRPSADECRAFRAEHAATASPVLASLGVLERVKGHDLLIDALPALLERHPGLVLLLGGEGAEHAALAERAARLGVRERVRFLGHLDDPLPLLASCDVYVHPSRSEGAPGAVLEALAQDRIVIATRVGGVEHILDLGDGTQAGVVVPPNDARALGNAILQVCVEPARAQERARRGGKSVRMRFSVDAMTEATLAVYRECVPSL